MASSLTNVLVPLCDATAQVIKAPSLKDSDYLFVSLDEKGEKFIVQAHGLRPDVCGDVTHNGATYSKTPFPSKAAASEWVQKVPERSELGFGRYSLATTDFTAIVIRHSWPEDRLIFTEEAELTYQYLLHRFFFQNQRARLTADFKINEVAPTPPDDYVPHKENPLVPYQIAALNYCLGSEESALFMDAGVGKTPVVINRICLEGQRAFPKKFYRALILCPKQVRMNWANEFSRFATTPGKVTQLRGGPIRRISALIDGIRQSPDCCYGACILSMDSVKSSWEALKKVPWDLVVVDESHYMKSPSSVRFKQIRQFTDISAKSRMILTGTPIANTIMDLYSQFEFLGKGMSGFSSFSAFRKFHGHYKKIETGGTAVQKLVGIRAAPLLQERLARVAFSMTKKEAKLNLPDKVYDIIEVEMTSEQKTAYRKIASDLSYEIQTMKEEGTITVEHVLTMLLRLAQVTSGHVKLDSDEDGNPGKVLQISNVNPKVDQVIEMLNDPGEDPLGKTIIWCHFIEDQRILAERMAKEGIPFVGYHSCLPVGYRKSGIEEAVKAYNTDPTIKVFIGNPASGGTGGNLVGYDYQNPEDSDTYTDHEIFFSTDWSSVKRSQAEDRGHRRGSRSSVRITDLIAAGTIDEEMRARVMQKRQTALMIQDITEILSRVLELDEE